MSFLSTPSTGPISQAKLLEKLQHFSPQLCHQIRRLEAIDGQQLTLRHPAVALIVDDAAVDRARHARRRGAYTIVHSEARSGAWAWRQ